MIEQALQDREQALISFASKRNSFPGPLCRKEIDACRRLRREILNAIVSPDLPNDELPF